VAEGLLNELGTEITEQSSASPADRLVGRGHFAYRILATEF